MKRLISLFLLAFMALSSRGADYAQRGPFTVHEGSASLVRPDQSTFTALLFHPGDEARAPFPAITFGHGFLGPPVIYRETLRHLASWGYIVIATQSALELFPDHAEYGEDLRTCLTYLENANMTPASPLFGLVDTNRFGASGHSMGGGASLLAAAADKRIKAVANLAAAQTRPSAIDAMKDIHVPVCLIAGSADRFTPLPFHTLPMYKNGNAPVLLPIILGGSHCGFVDFPLPSSLCDPYVVPLDYQLALSRSLLVAFFELNLRKDQSAWSRIWGPALSLDPRVQTLAQPGIDLVADRQRAALRVGESAEFQLQVFNSSGRTDRFDLLAEGNTNQLAWSTTTTPVLAPGEATTVTVRLALPPVVRGLAAVTVLSARSQADLATRASTVVALQPLFEALPAAVRPQGRALKPGRR